MKELAIGIGIGAAIKPGFNNAIGVANKGLSGLNQNLNKINSQRASIETVGKLENRIKGLTAKISDNQLKMKTLALTTGTSTKEYKNLEKETSKLIAQKSREENSYKKITESLKQQGMNMKNLGGEYDKLTAKAQRYEKAAAYSAKSDTWKGRAQAVGRAGTQMGIAGAAIGAALYKPAQEAINEQENWSEVRKLANFQSKEDEARYKERLQALIKEKDMAISIEELYSASATGFQAGLSQEETLGYIEAATKMGVSFGMARDETASYLYAWRNAFRMTLPQIMEFSDQINILGASTGASEAQIAQYVTELGNVSTQAGFATKDTAALGATLIEMGMTPEVAANASKKLFNVLANGTNGMSKTQIKMLRKVGINATQLSKLAMKDTDQAMDYLFSRLSKLKEHEQAGVFTALFGERGKVAGANIALSYDNYIKNRGLVNDSENYTGMTEEQYSIKKDTLKNDLLVATQQFRLAMVELGTGLMPMIKDVTASAVELIKKFSAWAKENPDKIRKYGELLAKLAASLLAASVAAKGLSASFHLVSAGFKISAWMTKVNAIGKMGGAFTAVGGVIKTAALGVGSALKSLFLNPVGLAIAGIAALVFAGYKIYKNWDAIKAKAIELAPKISELIDKFWWVLGPIGAIIKGGKAVYENWDTIKERSVQLKQAVIDMVINWVEKWDEFKTATSAALGPVFDWVNEKWASVKDTGASVIDFFVSAYEKIAGIFTSIGDGFSIMGGGIKNKWNSVKGFFGGNSSGESIPGFADGGIVGSPTLAMVGEGGSAEAIIPLNNNPNSLNLWQKAGEYIGGFKDRNSSSADTAPITVEYNYNPVIYANDATGVKDVLDRDRGMSQEKFNKMMDNYNRDRKRRSFDR